MRGAGDSNRARLNAHVRMLCVWDSLVACAVGLGYTSNIVINGYVRVDGVYAYFVYVRATCVDRRDLCANSRFKPTSPLPHIPRMN
jgi:hypothetical protein